MKKTLKRGLAFMLVVITLFSCISAGFAVSAVGKATIKATAIAETAITVSWSKVNGADGYRLYKYNFASKKWEALRTTTATSYTDKNLKKGSINAYGVKAIEVVDGKYVYGDASNIIQIPTCPGATSNLRATQITANSVTLSWNKAEGAQGYALYSYNTSKKAYDLIAAPSATSYKVTGLKASTSYRFAVRAYARKDCISYGQVANFLTIKTAEGLGRVQNLRLDAYNATAYRIKWDAVASADGYQVALYDTSAKKWVSLGTTTNTQAVLTAKNPLDNYLYKVRAYKKTADGYIFGELSKETYAFAKPKTPTGLEGAENSRGGITLKWDKIPGVSGYDVYTYDAINGKWVAVGSTTNNKYDITTITKTSHYKYKVRSVKMYNGKRFNGDFCESVTVNYHGSEADNSYSSDMEKSGVFGYLYEPKEKYFYTADDPWQRNIGYNSIFDVASPITLINFDTMRLRFEYGNKDWMIQVWKGQYGLIFYGAEVGVYTKPKDRKLMHYDCASDSELLKMSMSFYEYKNDSWQRRFTRPYGEYWWCTGFVPGNKHGNFDVLRLEIRITARDSVMLAGIKEALKQNGVSAKVSGMDVYFTY